MKTTTTTTSPDTNGAPWLNPEDRDSVTVTVHASYVKEDGVMWMTSDTIRGNRPADWRTVADRLDKYDVQDMKTRSVYVTNLDGHPQEMLVEVFTLSAKPAPGTAPRIRHTYTVVRVPIMDGNDHGWVYLRIRGEMIDAVNGRPARALFSIRRGDRLFS